MSVPTAAFVPATAPEYPRHVVTAVLVSHDGARWLPDALAGLLGQERPVQNVIAADTGSADDSARLLTESLGADRVLHLARRSGFGTAVEEAVRTAGVLTPDDLPYLKRPSSWDPETRSWRDDAYDMPELPHGEPVQWLWLLHDDCAPDPEALAELLRVADADEYAAVVGAKLRGWYDRKQLLEVGVSIANSGRRWTGLDRREQDQGQHDQVRSVLSVSSAGMLVRRDVWEELGGFDRRLPLMRDDVDLCWRAHAAGHRVLVAPDAVLRHAEAAARERRTVDCAGRSVVNPHRVDKAGAVYTMLVNARSAVLPWVLLRLTVGTLLRTVAYVVGKVPGQAVDEVMGLFGTLLRPGRILSGRRHRGKGVVDAAELRPLFPPPGATVRATVEQVASSLGAGSEPESGGSRHGAVESGPGGDDADFLEIEQFARLKKIAQKPGPVLFAILLIVSLVACRGLLGSGSLAGGALLPAPPGVGDLWSRYADAWHAVGTGGTQTAPPYLAVLASVSVIFLGSTGFTLTLLLVCSVPLAGVAAYFASRPLVTSRMLRAWASVAYAFLPAATGALATGRLGTAVLAILLPMIARTAVSAYGLRGEGRGSWRATWAYAFLLTFAMAFTPVVWPLALVLGIGVLALRRDELTAYAPRVLAALATPVILLAPWSLSLLTGPAGFLREAGLDFGTGSASALDLLGMSPGGPKAVGGALLIGIVLAALAALLRGERQFAVRVGWVVAVVALIFAVLSNNKDWAGPATLVYGIALIAVAAIGADGARERVASQSFGWRQPVAGLIGIAALLAPLIAAFGWMITGAAGPLERRDPVQVPAFVAEESVTRDQPRTLVLGGTSPAEVSYSLVRGSGSRLGDAELLRAAGSDERLDKVVANLVAGSGADQTDQLSGFAVRYVLVRDGAPRQMSRVLDATPGLSRLSQLDGSALWRVDRQISRATIVGDKAGGEPLAVAAGAVEAHTKIPAGDAGRILRIADSAAPGWQATLDGKTLRKKTVDGWAQGFELPAEGGRLDLTYDEPITHTAWVWAQGLLALVLLVLALPGRRREVDDDLPEEDVEIPAQPVAGEGRRARRLRAAAEAEGAEYDPEAAEEADGDAAEAPARTAANDGFDAFGTGQQEAVPAQPDAPQTPDLDPYGQPAQAGTAQVPQQQAYGEWDSAAYVGADYTQYQNEQPYQGEQQPYQGDPQYQPDAYGEQQYQQPYQQQPYDPSAAPYDPAAAPYDPAQYDPAQYDQTQYDPYGYGQQQPYPEGTTGPDGTGDEHDSQHRPDGSSNQ
ncbi:family 2 glycosyl transferase [Streptomyces sp. AcH 505]|uniref:glycosyltransferase n=1 Tax=Streptomyces sp. AcH 505 TaxID=352211 RepID=UPI000591CB34|nr:family 2 glycosyl transferase [Streptomyces sp. AcH 505]